MEAAAAGGARREGEAAAEETAERNGHLSAWALFPPRENGLSAAVASDLGRPVGERVGS